MCLAVPGKIIGIEKKDGNELYLIDYGAEKREAYGSAVEGLKVGDYVIISNKIIVTKVSKEKANEFLEMIK